MHKKKIKLIFAIFMILQVLFTLGQMANVVEASMLPGGNNGFIGFDQFGTGNADVDNAAKFALGTGVQVVSIVGTGVAIIMLTYIAIRYMSAAPEERAEFKKSATIYILGAILVFAASQVLGMIQSFVGENIK